MDNESKRFLFGATLFLLFLMGITVSIQSYYKHENQLVADLISEGTTPALAYCAIKGYSGLYCDNANRYAEKSNE